MNRIKNAFLQDKKLVSVYFTAGFPQRDDTVGIIKSLQEHGADMIEIGLPFSDPLADGPVIQASSTRALENGMTTKLLFEQLEGIRESITVPLIIMGYFNPILQFGLTGFLQKCQQCGIDGLIIPDLPPVQYEKEYQSLFAAYGISPIFLITHQTSEDRIRYIDRLSDSFLYMVSGPAVTGGTGQFNESNSAYFKRISELNLSNPVVTGFGIHDRDTFCQATAFSQGAIIGSAYINMLEEKGIAGTAQFLQQFY